jgi:hypothetical protein
MEVAILSMKVKPDYLIIDAVRLAMDIRKNRCQGPMRTASALRRPQYWPR